MAREDSRIATVRMHKQIYQQVERRAELQGMSVSGYLGRVITRHIEATPEPTVQEAIDMLEPARASCRRRRTAPGGRAVYGHRSVAT